MVSPSCNSLELHAALVVGVCVGQHIGTRKEALLNEAIIWGEGLETA